MPGRRWRGVQATVAALLRQERCHLPVKHEDGAVHDGLVHQHAEVIDEVARREVVRAVDEDVKLLGDFHGVLGVDVFGDLDDLRVRVDLTDGVLGGVDFGAADVIVSVQELSVQVGDIDVIEINDADLADTGGGKVHGEGGAEPAGPDEEYARVHQLALPHTADLRHDDVPTKSLHLLGRHRARRG